MDNDLKPTDLDDVADVVLGKTFALYSYNLTVDPIEFVIDGFQSIGITVVAGAPGTGKTSLLVPLYLHVAHLCAPDSPLKTSIRRRVVYVSEDPVQIKRILVGMQAKGGALSSLEDFNYWFIIKRAKRLNPIDLARTLGQYQNQYKIEEKNQFGVSYYVQPLIVLDTINATIDLQNENDNSEVGQVIALIKGSLTDNASLVLVTHTSKGMKRLGVEDLSPRGASAFMGDANAIQYVIKEDHLENERFLILGKRRFEPEFTEIRFKTECYIEEIITPQGTTQKIPIRYAIPFKGSKNDRNSANQDEKKRALAVQIEQVRNDIINAVKFLQPDGKTSISRHKISTKVDGLNKVEIKNQIELMIEDGILEEYPLPAGAKRSGPNNKTTIGLAKQAYQTYATRDEV